MKQIYYSIFDKVSNMPGTLKGTPNKETARREVKLLLAEGVDRGNIDPEDYEVHYYLIHDIDNDSIELLNEKEDIADYFKREITPDQGGKDIELD